MKADRRVDRPLSDGVAAEDAILRIAPGPLKAGDLLLTGRELIDADVIRTPKAIDQEPAQVLVVKDDLTLRLVVGRVADVILIDVEVVVEKEPRFDRPIALIIVPSGLRPTKPMAAPTSSAS